MCASEARAFSTDGCAAHGLSDCLCDVRPIAGGVPVERVPFADRLLELGLTQQSFVAWAAEIAAWRDGQSLYLLTEA